MKPIPEESAEAEKVSRRSAIVRRPRAASLTPHFDVALDMDTDANFYTGLDKNISSGGLFIATYDIRPPGTSVTVTVALPSGKVLRRRAIVAWVRDHDERAIELPPGMGVAFEGLGEDEAEAIGSFMDRRDSLFWV
jgi:uncharacterized protein (TIGR02266 family)